MRAAPLTTTPTHRSGEIPERKPAEDRRRARAIFGAAIGLLVLSHLWGIARPFDWGHDGFMGAHFIGSARGVIRGGLALPVMPGLNEVPLHRRDAFVHHPLLANAEYTVAVAAFGAHEWVGRGVALAHTLLSALLLFLLVELLTGSALRGAAAGAAFALLPATHAFGSLIERDPLAIAYGLLTTYFVVRFLRAPEPGASRWGVFALLGGLLAANLDWEADYVLALLILACLWSGIRRRRRGPLLLAVGLGLAVAASAGIHYAIVRDAGLVQDVLASYRLRSGATIPTSAYVARIARWARIGFGWPGLLLVAGFLASFLARAVQRRLRPVDWLSAALLAAGAGHYILFRQACWIHIFLIAHFSAGVALAASTMLADAVELVHGWRRRGAGAAAVLVAIFAVAEAPATWAAAHEARERSDTLDQEGGYPFAEAEHLRIADEARCMLRPGERAATTPGLVDRTEFDYRLGHPFDEVPAGALLGPIASKYGAFIAEERQLNATQVAALAARHPARRLGRWLLFDLKTPGSGVTDFHFAPAHLSRVRSFFVAPVRPPLDVIDPTGRSASACGAP